MKWFYVLLLAFCVGGVALGFSGQADEVINWSVGVFR